MIETFLNPLELDLNNCDDVISLERDMFEFAAFFRMGSGVSIVSQSTIMDCESVFKYVGVTSTFQFRFRGKRHRELFLFDHLGHSRDEHAKEHIIQMYSLITATDWA